eukprot:m.90478 g.90478  ORF g.90478 m.90478 type:complete len:91 (+) comp8850_c1_seq25:2395-2667(+)
MLVSFSSIFGVVDLLTLMSLIFFLSNATSAAKCLKNGSLSCHLVQCKKIRNNKKNTLSYNTIQKERLTCFETKGTNETLEKQHHAGLLMA